MSPQSDVRLREQFWSAVLTDAARADRSITFTPESTVQPGFPARARQVVEGAGGRVCFVRLVVSEAEQERRIGSADRRRFHKLTDLDALRSMRDHREDVEQPPVDVDVDTDVSTPEQTVAVIVQHFDLTAQQRWGRYS